MDREVKQRKIKTEEPVNLLKDEKALEPGMYKIFKHGNILTKRVGALYSCIEFFIAFSLAGIIIFLYF